MRFLNNTINSTQDDPATSTRALVEGPVQSDDENEEDYVDDNKDGDDDEEEVDDDEAADEDDDDEDSKFNNTLQNLYAPRV